jgi:hypothetical protein
MISGGRQRVGQLREHRLDWRRYRKRGRHDLIFSRRHGRQWRGAARSPDPAQINASALLTVAMLNRGSGAGIVDKVRVAGEEHRAPAAPPFCHACYCPNRGLTTLLKIDPNV